MNIWTKFSTTAALALMLCMTMLAMSGTAFAQRCVDNGDETVTDNGTGLMWQKETAGHFMSWDQAMSYASSLSLGGHSYWQLPTIYELSGLYYSPCKEMMNVESSYYWSSTASPYVRNAAQLVGFKFGGHVASDDKSSRYYVRAVRSAQ